MINIFPRAEPAPIEQTIGHQRPSAHPPAAQICGEQAQPQRSPDFRPFSCSPRWFSRGEFSAYERRILADDGLLGLRNAILDLYATCGGPVTLGMCRGLADFPAVLKVFDFLEDHRLINYETSLRFEMTAVRAEHLTRHEEKGLGSESPAVATGEGHFVSRIARKVRRKYISRQFLEGGVCACGNKAELFTSDLFFVCGECFNTAAYPSRYTARNFHRITPSLLQSLWTKKEEFMLLKNIEQHGDDWGKVTDSLNKTIDQCIFHFLKMSLMDECDSFPSLCFSSVPNQVSTFISYIAFLVHPSISTELAKNAIKYIDRPNLMEILISVAISRAKEILELERCKKARIEKVETEALVRKISMKIDAVREMFAEVSMVKAELEAARERLIDEIGRK